MTNIIGQVAGGTISNGQGCYGASLLPDTFKKILLTLAEDRSAMATKLNQNDSMIIYISSSLTQSGNLHEVHLIPDIFLLCWIKLNIEINERKAHAP